MPPDDAQNPRSVLDTIADRTGHAPKVLLPDGDSEHGPSPLVDPDSALAKLRLAGRGNYQLLGEIARGGMGVILKGHDRDLGRDVAVKVLDGNLAKRPAVLQRFVEEAQIGGQLQHPGIVPVYELGLMADERPYFTMKLVKGHTLASMFAERKTPADNRGRLLSIFESVCQTVAYAHSKGVLHRDLKPANVMVGAFGEVQVVDWGLAKVLRRGGRADEKRAEEPLKTVIETVRSGPESTGSDSMVGSVMGTPAYMAPEQAQGEVEMLDERADVFSLGAILCELLTGRPPYEAVEGETIVSQAAHARLGPARARLEACDGDPALVRLCLDCLMTAREARPASAGVVARALHDFLASVEERAAKAELAAAEARVKAAEERRARKLTLALAGTVCLALVLVGLGWWYVGRERALRLEQTRTAVEGAQAESLDLGRAGKPDEALGAARRALSLAERGAADAGLLERVRHFVDQAEQAVGAAERERALAAQDERLRARLVDLQLEQIGPLEDLERARSIDAEYTRAFHDYGVDLEGDDLVPALERIRERAIAEDVALALDNWGSLRRVLLGPNSEKVENLFVLSMDLDPDPLRARMREAVAARDEATMRELASPTELPKLGPGSIFVLAAELWRDGSEARQPEVYRILDQGRQLYPGDFVLQACAGFFYDAGDRLEEALTARVAAVSLRPADVDARFQLAESQLVLGHLDEAQDTLRACLAAEPASLEANHLLGVVEKRLGDAAGSLASLSRLPEIAAHEGIRGDLGAAQYLNGLIDHDAYARKIRSETLLGSLAALLVPLVDAPDPKLRDPELVLRTLQERAPTFGPLRWPIFLEALARARLEDWAGAQALLETRYQLPRTPLVTRHCYDFLRSRVASGLGRDDEARAHYARALQGWEDETANDPAAWERSDLARWKREAEAALRP